MGGGASMPPKKFVIFVKLMPQFLLATPRRTGSSGWRLDSKSGECAAFATSPQPLHVTTNWRLAPTPVSFSSSAGL
uniref:Putative secreted protein n=1 Tax=Ixodes ricinus TaxID=34613 RepID=A0A6B0U2S1_IXORI